MEDMKELYPGLVEAVNLPKSHSIDEVPNLLEHYSKIIFKFAKHIKSLRDSYNVAAKEHVQIRNKHNLVVKELADKIRNNRQERNELNKLAKIKKADRKIESEKVKSAKKQLQNATKENKEKLQAEFDSALKSQAESHKEVVNVVKMAQEMHSVLTNLRSK